MSQKLNDCKEKNMIENNNNISNENNIDNNYNFFDEIPKNIYELLKKYYGITELFEWQKNILKMECIEKRQNLIYTSPTGGGKSLISDLLLIRNIINDNKNCIYIVPFISLANEKYTKLLPLANELDFIIEEYAGTKGAIPIKRRFKKKSLYICTIEKCLILINSLFSENRINSIGLIIIDEIHMLNEFKRGIILELILTKLLFFKINLQIIGMSANIPNVNKLVTFMNAQYFSSLDRPIELIQYLMIDYDLYKLDILDEKWKENMKFIKKYQLLDNKISQNANIIIQLIQEINEDHPTLIFCPTKKNCQITCENLIKKIIPNRQKLSIRVELIKSLECISGNISPLLRKSIIAGIAYHHAGLIEDERKLIEKAFIASTIYILCCTSTLAAGVNLPANRVIIKSPKIGFENLSYTNYLQMIGRAGRPGLSTYGESILTIEKNDINLLDNIFINNQSNYRDDTNLTEDELSNFILSLFINDTQIYYDEIYDFIRRSLTYYTIDSINKLIELDQHIKNSLKSLKENSLIIHENDSNKYKLSKIGISVSIGIIEIKNVKNTLNDLKNSLQHFCLSSDLNLLFICTPPDIIPPTFSVSILTNLIQNLSESEIKIINNSGLTQIYIDKISQNDSIKNIDSHIKNLSYRWISSIIILQISKGIKLSSLSTDYNISRGSIKSVTNNMITYSKYLYRLTKEIHEFWHINKLIKKMIRRIQQIHSSELLPLLKIKGIKYARAKLFYRAGYRTLQNIVESNEQELIEKIPNLSRRQASFIIHYANLTINNKTTSQDSL